MFQINSPENAFVFRFSILGDGIVFSEFVFLSMFPPTRSTLVCLVWFGLEAQREFRRKVSFLGPIQVPDAGPVIQVLAFFLPLIPAVVQIRSKR